MDLKTNKRMDTRNLKKYYFVTSDRTQWTNQPITINVLEQGVYIVQDARLIGDKDVFSGETQLKVASLFINKEDADVYRTSK